MIDFWNQFLMPPSLWALYFLAFVVSLAISLAGTPLARRVALKIGFVDQPEARKFHKTSTPYLGGAVIWIACMLGVFALVTARVSSLSHLSPWALGTAVLLAVGLYDDRHGMMPRTKFSAQILAGLGIVLFGDRFTVLDQPVLDSALTLFWIVGLSNAVNLLDNMDGLSAGTTGISCFFLFLLAATNGQFLVAGMAISIVGACLGFLRYNFSAPKASIFMGDAGSLFLGFTLAYAGIRLRLPVSGLWDFLIPLIVLGLPVLDTTLVTTMRVRAGRPVSLGGKDHCSHRLVKMGYTPRKAVLIHYGIAAAFGVFGVILRFVPADTPVFRWCVLAGATLMAARFFSLVARVEVYQEAPVPAENPTA